MAVILTIIPYKFYPPIGGGALRCFYIMREMANNHTVYVITTQPENDFFLGEQPAFPDNVNIISVNPTKLHRSKFNLLLSRLAEALKYRWLRRSFNSTTNSYFLSVYPLLHELISRVKFDIFYYENLEALDLFEKVIKRHNRKALHLYDAHNCDSELWLQLATANNSFKMLTYANRALALENKLYKKVNAFFCCSEEDNWKLTKLNENKIKGVVIPNGVDVASRPFDDNNEKYLIKQIIFCGSLDYLPNREGILWFYKEVLPLLKINCKTLTLIVVGEVTKIDAYKELLNDPFVNFVGKVESVVPYYKASSVAIAPIISGSGTRLKILEAMSMGNPVVSTMIGAEGLNCVPGKHLLLANQPVEYAHKIMGLLSDREKFNFIRNQAFNFVKSTYDWKTIGEKIEKSLRSF
jgi:polysaccharide biosynthesis protein PslH